MKTNVFLKNLAGISIVLIFYFAATAVNAAPGNLDTTLNGTGKMRVGVGGTAGIMRTLLPYKRTVN